MSPFYINKFTTNKQSYFFHFGSFSLVKFDLRFVRTILNHIRSLVSFFFFLLQDKKKKEITELMVRIIKLVLLSVDFSFELISKCLISNDLVAQNHQFRDTKSSLIPSYFSSLTSLMLNNEISRWKKRLSLSILKNKIIANSRKFHREK